MDGDDHVALLLSAGGMGDTLRSDRTCRANSRASYEWDSDVSIVR